MNVLLIKSMRITCDGCEGRLLLGILHNVKVENLSEREYEFYIKMLDDLDEYVEFIEYHFTI